MRKDICDKNAFDLQSTCTMCYGTGSQWYDAELLTNYGGTMRVRYTDGRCHQFAGEDKHCDRKEAKTNAKTKGQTNRRCQCGGMWEWCENNRIAKIETEEDVIHNPKERCQLLFFPMIRAGLTKVLKGKQLPAKYVDILNKIPTSKHIIYLLRRLQQKLGTVTDRRRRLPDASSSSRFSWMLPKSRGRLLAEVLLYGTVKTVLIIISILVVSMAVLFLALLIREKLRAHMRKRRPTFYLLPRWDQETGDHSI